MLHDVRRVFAPFRLSISLTLLLAVSLSAAESSSWWNPFGGREKQATDTARSSSRTSESKPTSSFASFPTLPKLRMPGATESPATRAKEPSTWDKVSGGTKSFFSKAKGTLMPWTVDSKEPARGRGTSSARSSKSRNKSSEKSSGWTWFGGSDEEEEKIESVNDFLKLPTPQ